MCILIIHISKDLKNSHFKECNVAYGCLCRDTGYNRALSPYSH